VVFILKYRRKVIYRELRQYLGKVFRKLALQEESRIEQGHLMRYQVSHPNSRFERPHL
jgi:putative transposase